MNYATKPSSAPKKMGQVFAPKSAPSPSKKPMPQSSSKKFGELQKGAKKC